MRIKSKLKSEILKLTRSRGPEKTICPSEAARAYDSEHWRDVMDETRKAAAELRDEGKITIEQEGERVDDFDDASGPIRLRIND